MLKTLAALALAGSALLGSASSAAPSHRPVPVYGMQAWDKEGSAALIEVARSHDIKVIDGHQWCYQDRNLYGIMNNKFELTLCVDNIPTPSLLGEVIRHELIHAAQFCRIRRGKPPLVAADRFEGFKHYALYALSFDGSTYPESHFEIEVEARVMGNIYSNSQVASILDKECGL